MWNYPSLDLAPRHLSPDTVIDLRIASRRMEEFYKQVEEHHPFHVIINNVFKVMSNDHISDPYGHLSVGGALNFAFKIMEAMERTDRFRAIQYDR